MLDGLLGRGFASKCKPLIKLTKTRIDVVRRKRKATEKFLKKDIADLLANGLDINAYQRADGLLVELMLSSCYDFVEQSCDLVLKHLSIMQKQRECPEDYREAVSSLMFAAARFSELPELRKLRQIFQDRYGNSLELYVNQEFVENSASKPSTLEKKVQLMQDIVLEYSITWDSKAFEKRMYRPSTCVQEQPTNYGSFNVTTNKNEPYNGMGTIPRGEKPNVSFKERLEVTNDGRGLCNGLEGTISKRELDIQSRHELSGKGYDMLNYIERDIPKKDGHDISYQGRQEVVNGKHEAWNLKGDATAKPVTSGTSSRKKPVIDGRPRLLIGRENKSPANDCRGSLLHGKPEIYPSFAGQQSKGNAKEPLAGNNHSGQHDVTKSVKKFEKGVIIDNVKPQYNKAPSRQQSKGNAKEPLAGNNHAGQHDVTKSVKKFEKDVIIDNVKPQYNKAPSRQQSKGNAKEPLAGNNHAGQHDVTKSVKKFEKDVIIDNVKPQYNKAPPPYVKPNLKAKTSKSGPNLGSSMAGFGSSVALTDTSMRKGGRATNTSERIQLRSDHCVHQRQVVGTASLNGHGQEKDHLDQDGVTSNSSSKLRSARRHAKSHHDHNNAGYFEDTGRFTRKPRSKGRDNSRRGLQILFDDEQYHNNEEEKILDKLLMQYSKKPSPYELGRVRKSKTNRAHHMSTDVRKSPQNGKDVPDEKPEAVPPPPRSVSLPREHTGQPEVTKKFSRAVSFQSDRSSLARHVHPKLPDYDDLAAKFAALRGK
ncbi:uncharacterized protein LOC122308294 [Carya illinoinensis]|uniref:Uncharacterized protein n=1 Tax=Carya illinoinensis TaxID=32201 RepID=A0A8T1QW40_CARIL|nr:uncharacterized protein LOC122308294 [Carya illinoinensis]KAG6658479.1 hypothetical protein CIPAW_04G164500 [Carya illinoinensis]KAG6718671.1 hypothetical protein I3842_04G163400 [Carya illinoinensis]